MNGREPIPLPGLFERAQAAAAFVRGHGSPDPRIGIVLGSGLGGFATQIADASAIAYADIPHFPRSTVLGHAGRLVLGSLAGVRVAVMQGRVHAYEGYPLAEVVFPVRVLGLLGCETLLLTNAAGAIDPALRPGTFALLSDHINLTGGNAAAGENDARFGRSGQNPAAQPAGQPAERFFDMSGAYSPRLRAHAHAAAAALGLTLPEAVYCGVLGPSFETPAEIRAFRTLGADLVGMSTVHETIAARQMGIEVLGLSLVTNFAAGVSPEPIAHDDVLALGERAAPQLAALVAGIVGRL